VGGGGGGHQIIGAEGTQIEHRDVRIRDSRMRRESNAWLRIRIDKQKSLYAVLTGMSVPHGQGWLHHRGRINQRREQFGRGESENVQGRMFFRPPRTICGLSTPRLRGELTWMSITRCQGWAYERIGRQPNEWLESI